MKEELKGPKVENVSVAVIEVVIENEKSYCLPDRFNYYCMFYGRKFI